MKSLDVVGIGALNVDFIADVSSSGLDVERLRRRIENLPDMRGGPWEWGTERSVGSDAISSVLEIVNGVYLEASVGGSAFNAIFALAHMGLGLRLGYVGVSGRAPRQGLSGMRQLDDVGVDTSAILVHEDALSGTCFCIQERAERTLLTHAGANALMAGHLERNHDGLVDYLSGAKVLHVTSFLDPETPDRLLDLLTAVKSRNPGIVVCFDPGHEWSLSRSRAVLEMVRLCDYLLVNQREFQQLGRSGAQEPCAAIAHRMFEGLLDPGCTVVVKRAGGIKRHRWEGGGPVSRFFPQQELAPEEIQDATGAGDVFAAGILAVLAGGQSRSGLGVLLGMELARHKLQFVGSHGHASFADITQRFIPSRAAARGGQCS